MTTSKLSQETVNKLNKWRRYQQIKQINVTNIFVSHPIHLNAKSIEFNNPINKLIKIKGKIVPIVVKKVSDSQYQLLFGIKQLIIAKLLNHKTIDTIVVSCSREDLVKYLKHNYTLDNTCQYNINNIVITKKFAETIPNKIKIETKRKQIQDNMIPLITIKKDTGELVDGYITYLLLKEQNVSQINVRTI